jgi:hypothetical protein
MPKTTFYIKAWNANGAGIDTITIAIMEQSTAFSNGNRNTNALPHFVGIDNNPKNAGLRLLYALSAHSSVKEIAFTGYTLKGNRIWSVRTDAAHLTPDSHSLLVDKSASSGIMCIQMTTKLANNRVLQSRMLTVSLPK